MSVAGDPKVRSLTQDHLSELRSEFGERLSTSRSLLEQHGHGECWHPTEPPDAVLFAESRDDVARAVKICARYKRPVIAFGAGTSLEGHVCARAGGLSLDLSRMNRVLDVSVADLLCTVEAGVTRKSLESELRSSGVFFAVDPGADATIGGMAATRASGTNAVKYGTMRENVLGLTVVLADGNVIKTGTRAPKSAAGYDLTRLFVGSEGTLGIITDVTVRLHGVPESIAAAVCTFPDIDSSIRSVTEIIQSGIDIARVEFMDETMIEASNRYSKRTQKVAPTLFMEFHGTQQSVSENARATQAITAGAGGDGFQWTTSPEERKDAWHARHNAWYAILSTRPGAKGLATDVCVPISKLAECIAETKRDLLASVQVPVAMVGHVGDGNFHLGFALDPENPGEISAVLEISDRLIRRALSLGGTCSGEHGIGYGKMQWLPLEHGAEAVEVMRSIKRSLDPHNILNPGKLVEI